MNESSKSLKIINPWQGAKNVTYQYSLIDDSSFSTGDSLKKAFLKIPFKKIICLSTTHVAFADALGRSSSIVGVSGLDFVYSENVRENIRKGLTRDVGYDQNLNYELIVSLKPDAVFCYGIGNESLGYLNKLKELGITLIFIGDYLEEHPLGKAEWIKVFGLLLGEETRADSLFNNIEQSYTDTRKLVLNCKSKPCIFLNAPWKDSWFFPGSSSYFIRLIEDAGGNYIFSNLQGSRSYSIGFEKAIEAGLKTDFWLNPGTADKLTDISSIDDRLSIIPPFKKGNIYNNNNRMSDGGGNDFWESGVIHPDLILKDLIHIFHPEKLPDHRLYYYKKVK